MKNKSKLGWTCAQLSKNVFEITWDVRKTRDTEKWVLCTSDQHWDHPRSDRELQLKHMKEARERNAPIFSCGDLFCLMQGKYDKRSDKKDIRPEHAEGNYFDSIIDTSVDFFSPYADLWTVIAMGNHEQAIADRHETNMIDRFVGVLNHQTKSHIFNGGFSGWIIFKFKLETETGLRQSHRKVLHYDHGYGGGGSVTKDLIQHNRRAVYLTDADIVVSGHTHDSWVVEMSRLKLRDNGEIKHDIQTHVKIPSYKQDYDLGNTWAATRGHPPKPLGAYWLRFKFERKFEGLAYDVIKAG